MTTQQSGVAGACGAERSQKLVKSLVRTAFRGEPLFRSLRPDFIETRPSEVKKPALLLALFRSLRPDFIETVFLLLFSDFYALIVPVSKTGLH